MGGITYAKTQDEPTYVVRAQDAVDPNPGPYTLIHTGIVNRPKVIRN